MKKFYFLFLFALIASIGNLYAAEKTVTWNFAGRKSGTSATTSCELKVQTGSASGTWEMSASEAFHAQTGSGSTSVTLGSKRNPCKDAKLELTNSPIPKVAQIKKVSITAKASKKEGATFGLQIGGVPSGTTLTFNESKTTQEFTETKGGNVVLVINTNTLNQANVSLYSISITYEEVAETKCATPTFSLASGSYTTAQTVTITGPEGSTITYTLNEAIFEAPSPVNVELPLVEGVSTTYNLSALASMKDFKDSEETKAVYVINESYADKTATLNIADYASANKWVNLKQYPDVEIDDVKFAIKGGGNDGKYYSSDETWRVYSSTNGTLTISVPAMHIISSVVYKATNAFAEADSGTLSEGAEAGEWKWDAAATNTTEGDPVNSVIFTAAGNKKNVELKEVKVYYAYDPVSSVSSMSVDGVKVFAAEGGVKVVAEEAADVAVYTAAGQLVRQARVAEGSTLVNVAPGFYVVRANGTATKVIVR